MSSNSIRPVAWNKEKVKQEIPRRFRAAQEGRKGLEGFWERSERTMYSATNDYNQVSDLSASSSAEVSYQVAMPGVDTSDSDVAMSYAFKNIRFIHAQMSSNPPSVVMRPATSDQDDRRAADASDRIVRYCIRHYSLQEKVDQLSLQALIYGTGCIKIIWDQTKGDILEQDAKTGEVVLEGDLAVSIPHIWNIFIDPDAHTQEDIKWVIERVYIDFDEAMARWPEKEDELKKSLATKRGGDIGANSGFGGTSTTTQQNYNVVELLEYWETGLATNGYLGRYCLSTREGDEIEPVRPSPYRFPRAGERKRIIADTSIDDDVRERRLEKLPQMAELPYHFLSDVDVPNCVWGKSVLDYTCNLQDTLNRLDSSRLDGLQASAVTRLVLPETANLAEGSLTNSNWDIVKITGSQPPFYMTPPQSHPDMQPMRADILLGINDVHGVNEAMFGQQSREQSGASMQYATNQGNMIRRRLFNKYVLVVESLYKGILNLIRKHWTTTRTIHVLGKEKALEAVDVKGMDIDGGYDVVGEYGVSLSLDPITRREEILSMQPLFEKANVPPRLLLRMLKLNELEGVYDLVQMAEDRQREIFEEMMADNIYIEPRKFQDHTNMIAYAMQYFMTTDFKYLERPMQDLCEKHITARIAMAAQEAAGSAGGVAGQAPGGAGVPPGTPPAPVPVGSPPLEATPAPTEQLPGAAPPPAA